MVAAQIYHICHQVEYIRAMATLSADNVRRAYFKDEHIDFSGIHRLSRTPGGFQNHEVRKLLWPTLLGIENKDVCKKFSTFVDNKHRDIQQISNDIDRSLWKQDCLQDWSLERRQVERLRLQNIINAVLARNEALHYYQGFHDICSIFYLVFEDDPLTFSCIEALALYFIRDDMRENFDSVMELMRLVFVVIEKVDFELYQYLTATKAEPFFTISWLLTWFAHDISHMQDIARLYDAILCSHPIYIIYLCSSFTMYYRSALMSKERDFGSVQNFFVKAPTVLGVPLEDIIRDADTIYSLFPEDELVRCSSAHMKELLGSHR